jgi:serine O-acetyltransferase
VFDTIKADMKRFTAPEGTSLREILAGMLSPGFQAILVYRFFNWCHRHKIPAQPIRYIVERFVEVTTGISIPACCSIGKGLRIHHFGGVILHPSAEIGENCTLYHEVTIGDIGGLGGAARIGNNVLLGVGAKIIGELEIGDNCTVGANAVVTRSMPADYLAYGNPAVYRSKSGSEES